MKKRSLSIYFVSVLLLINFLFSDGIRFSSADQLFPVIYQNGTQITGLSLSALEKTTLSVRAADAYQWQALIPYSEQWVDIRGEADATCEISHPMLASIADCCNQVKLRCDVTNHGENEQTLPITISLLPPDNSDAPIPTSGESSPSRMRLHAAANEPDDYTTRTVTIKYLYYNEGPTMTGSVSNDYIATLATGTNYTTSVPSPYRTGYKAYVAAIGDWNGTRWFTDDVNEASLQSGDTISLNVTNIQNIITYYVVYLPQSASFLTRHYLQNLYDDFYSYQAEQKMDAKVGTVITNATNLNISYEGFTMLQYDDATVAADGSTVVELYFDRDYHLMNFQLNGGYGVEPIYARYGTEFRVAKPTKAGYEFKKWSVVPDSSRTDAQNAQAEAIAEALANGEAVTIPAFDIVFQAVWNTKNVSATVVFWYENANDDGYSYINHVTVENLEADSEISSETYKNLSFDGRDNNHFTYNPEKAETVTVNGDASTYLNIYFTRNVYTVVFTDYEGPYSLVENCSIPEHSHDLCFGEKYHAPMCYGATTNALTPAKLPERDTGHYGYANYISVIKNPTDGLMACYKGSSVYYYYFYCNGVWYYLGTSTAEHPTIKGLYFGGTRPSTSYAVTQYQIHHLDTCYSTTPRNYGANEHLTPATDSNWGYSKVSALTDLKDGTMACYKGSSDYYYYFYCDGVWYYLGINNASTKPTIKGLYFGGTRPSTNYTVTQYQLTANPVTCDIEEHTHNVSDGCENNNVIIKTGIGNYIYQIIQAKYYQDITDVWPLTGQNYGYTTVPSNYSSWRYKGYGSSKETDQVTRQNTMISNLCNPNGQIVPLITTSNPGNIQANYYTESLTGTGAYSYKGKTYDLDSRFTQIVPITLSAAKNIDGMKILHDEPINVSSTEQAIYYDRNRYKIKLDNGYNNVFATISGVMFEQPLSTVTYQGKSLSEVVPPYPDTLQDGVYEFDGWYTTPGHIPGTEADFSIIMPNQDLIYYANWKKVSHTVTFYESYNDMLNGQPITDTSYGTNPTSVTHGESVPYASTISREGYNFVGWFYIDDETHEKISFLPGSMPVNKELHVYAEWIKSTMIRYTIHYIGAEPIDDNPTNGQYQLNPSTFLKIADDTTGQIQDGRTKTFSAKALPELYDGYNTGYFPTLSNHAILFMENTAATDPTVTVNKVLPDGSPCTDDTQEHTYNIEYTFYYVHLNEVQYTVNYINLATNTNVFKSKNDGTITVNSDQHKTSEAVTTERFKLISGYAPDEYQKRLILTADPEKNVINFYYTEDSHPAYLIEHMTENLDGTWTIQSSEFEKGTAGQTITAYSKEYVGHVFDPDQTWVNTQGVALKPAEGDEWVVEYTENTEKGCYEATGILYDAFTPSDEYILVIRFYYPLEEYTYTVEHKILSTNQYVFGDQASSSESATAKYGERITADATPRADDALALGYWVEGSREDPSRLMQSEVITEANSIITFWYVDEPIEINYRIVVDGAAGVNINGCYVTPTLDSSNSHEETATISGSTPHASLDYYFVGWYKDEACTIPVESSWVDNNHKLTPQAESTPKLYKAATYYAKVEPNTLNIVKTGTTVSESDLFLFRVKGTGTDNADIDITVSVQGTGSTTITHIPRGNYTVTELTDWSWRYTTDDAEQSVTVAANATVTFENTRNTDQKWLGGETNKDNRFSAYTPPKTT